MQRIDKNTERQAPFIIRLGLKDAAWLLDSALLLIWGSVNADFQRMLALKQKQKQKQRM